MYKQLHTKMNVFEIMEPQNEIKVKQSSRCATISSCSLPIVKQLSLMCDKLTYEHQIQDWCMYMYCYQEINISGITRSKW